MHADALVVTAYGTFFPTRAGRAHTCAAGGSSMVGRSSTIVGLHKQAPGAPRRQELQHVPLSVEGRNVCDGYSWPASREHVQHAHVFSTHGAGRLPALLGARAQRSPKLPLVSRTSGTCAKIVQMWSSRPCPADSSSAACRSPSGAAMATGPASRGRRLLTLLYWNVLGTGLHSHKLP